MTIPYGLNRESYVWQPFSILCMGVLQVLPEASSPLVCSDIYYNLREHGKVHPMVLFQIKFHSKFILSTVFDLQLYRVDVLYT